MTLNRLESFFRKNITIQPALLTLVFLSLMVAIVITATGGNPLELARIGTYYDQ
jgi:hypothetical protein